MSDTSRKIACPHCGGPVREESIDFAKGSVSCPWCDSAFLLPRETPAAPRAAEPVLRPKVELPRGITVEEHGRRLVIWQRWFTPAAIFLTLFCVLWNGFLVFWFSMVLGSGLPPLMALVPIIHVGVGIGLAYLTVAMYVNRTRIEVDDDAITVVHEPLPMPGGSKIGSRDVQQLYCKRKVRSNGRSARFQVFALLMSGARKRIVSGTLSEDQALYVEQEVERFLGLDDRAVAGEIRG